ncbi:MAG: hypothetical protein WBG92_18820 [Thiohalocapsa sp.]
MTERFAAFPAGESDHRDGESTTLSRISKAWACVAVAAMISLLPVKADTIYKCVQPDRYLEYSNVPCAPDEGAAYITGETFSVVSKRGAGVGPPVNIDAIRRQQRMAADAKEPTSGFSPHPCVDRKTEDECD